MIKATPMFTASRCGIIIAVISLGKKLVTQSTHFLAILCFDRKSDKSNENAQVVETPPIGESGSKYLILTW